MNKLLKFVNDELYLCKKDAKREGWDWYGRYTDLTTMDSTEAYSLGWYRCLLEIKNKIQHEQARSRKRTKPDK